MQIFFIAPWVHKKKACNTFFRSIIVTAILFFIQLSTCFEIQNSWHWIKLFINKALSLHPNLKDRKTLCYQGLENPYTAFMVCWICIFIHHVVFHLKKRTYQFLSAQMLHLYLFPHPAVTKISLPFLSIRKAVKKN